MYDLVEKYMTKYISNNISYWRTIMRIVYLRLVNFIGVKAATGLNEIEFKYDQIKQPIIQLYGKNRCGKTVMIQQHHPFSSINLNGDERNDLDLIIPGEVGIKNIVYEVNGNVYNILHTYKPTSKSHTISTSITHNGEELNPSGGVTNANMLIEKILGINKYIFQFIINGTNLTSFAGMGASQRKTLLNKAMGIDIYDKIHKLATDDYRFTNKLISSLNHTKEYLLSTYGSYETLFATVDAKRSERDRLDYELQTTKTKIDQLSGKIQTIQQQNPSVELYSIDNQIMDYQRAVEHLGAYDAGTADQLIDMQIEYNKTLSELKAKRSILLKEIDDGYDKQHSIESSLQLIQQSKLDHDSMCNTIESLKSSIDKIRLEVQLEVSSQYLFSMLSVAQAINSTCKEIVSSLKREHLEFMVDMILHGIDVSAFLIKEGSAVLDSEKEKSMITYIRSMMNSVDGEIPDQSRCSIQNCLYRNVYDAFETYFNSYQSTKPGEYTQYDLEQMDHAYKNILTIKRLINIEITDPNIKDVFTLKSILNNILKYGFGVDVDFIKYLIEQATKQEQRNQYIKQLHESEQSLLLIKERMKSNTNPNESIDDLKSIIINKEEELKQIDQQIEKLNIDIKDIDERRVMMSAIQKIDILSLNKRSAQLHKQLDELSVYENEYNTLASNYNQLLSTYKTLTSELDTLEKAFDQYVKTSSEIEQNMSNDSTFKAIAEATSSTKGIPVIAIRDTVERAIHTANQLLDVMYDHEIELLHPTIDETNFSLPFRCGNNKSSDIRYGSQSESTLLSLALSLSLSTSLTNFNIPLVDEIDAYLDMSFRDDFILMLESMMSKLGMEQMFLISHNLQKGQFSHIVHAIDLSEIILQSEGK